MLKHYIVDPMLHSRLCSDRNWNFAWLLKIAVCVPERDRKVEQHASDLGLGHGHGRGHKL